MLWLIHDGSKTKYGSHGEVRKKDFWLEWSPTSNEIQSKLRIRPKWRRWKRVLTGFILFREFSLSVRHPRFFRNASAFGMVDTAIHGSTGYMECYRGELYAKLIHIASLRFELFLIACISNVPKQGDFQIRVGMLVSENVDPVAIGYSTSGGAIAVALDRIRNESLLNGYDFTLVLLLYYSTAKIYF